MSFWSINDKKWRQSELVYGKETFTGSCWSRLRKRAAEGHRLGQDLAGDWAVFLGEHSFFWLPFPYIGSSVVGII